MPKLSSGESIEKESIKYRLRATTSILRQQLAGRLFTKFERQELALESRLIGSLLVVGARATRRLLRADGRHKLIRAQVQVAYERVFGFS